MINELFSYLFLLLGVSIAIAIAITAANWFVSAEQRASIRLEKALRSHSRPLPRAVQTSCACDND